MAIFWEVFAVILAGSFLVFTPKKRHCLAFLIWGASDFLRFWRSTPVYCHVCVIFRVFSCISCIPLRYASQFYDFVAQVAKPHKCWVRMFVIFHVLSSLVPC